MMVSADLSERGLLALAFAMCVVAREDADKGDTTAAYWLCGEFALTVRGVLEDEPGLVDLASVLARARRGSPGGARSKGLEG